MPDISNMPNMPTKIDEYLERVFRISKSYSTKRSYQVALNKFQNFLSSLNTTLPKILGELMAKNQDPVILLDDYYTYLSKENLRNSTIAGYISVAKDFLNFHGLKIYTEDIKRRFRPPKKDVFYENGLTKAILSRLLHNCPPKLQAAILIACSSGMRLGELVQLRLLDIDFTTNPTTIRLRRETTKTHVTRFTHITNEATNALNDYIQRSISRDQRNTNPYLFINYQGEEGTLEYYKAVVSARGSLMNTLREIVRKVPELSLKNENGNFTIHFHAFRKWFKTQVTNAQESDFAEALMGHQSLKLTYYISNHQDRMKIYKKVEPSLTISDFTKIEKTIDQLQEQVAFLTTELEKVKQLKQVELAYKKVQ